MGVFDDKKFEELDWISQTTEPIDSDLNVFLEKLPDELDINFDTFIKMVNRNYSLDLSIANAISYLIDAHAVTSEHINGDHFDELAKCFKFESTGLDLQINFETRSIDGGAIKLVKIATTLDEKVLENILGKEGIRAVANLGYVEPAALGRMNDIMELLGNCEAGLKSRAVRKKRQAITNRLMELFKKNEWNIKETKLADKVGIWIADYVKQGNLAAMSNFCRLKVMTHKNQPIYSMEEVE